MSASRTGLHTPSLRRRVTLVVLVLLAAMLLAVSVVTDTVLANRLDAQLRQRLADRATVAAALVDQVEPRDLARRLEGDGVSAVVTVGDEVYAEGQLGGGATAGTPGAASEPPAPGPGEGPAGGPPTPAGPAGAADRASTPEEVDQSGELLSLDRDLGDDTSVRLLASTSDIAATLDQLRLALALAAALVLLLAGAVVPLVVDRALRPLGRITAAAREIGRGDRQRRLSPDTPASELGRTATAFDEMLDEITGAEDRAVVSEERVRRFLSDAAHDLRTPLTGVQAAAERVLRDDPPRDEREQVLLTLVRESRRAGRMVDDMLLMSRIDGGLPLQRSPADLLGLAREVVDAQQLTSPGADLRAAGAPVVVAVDRDRVLQVLANLVRNAAQAGARTVVVSTGTTGAHGSGDAEVRVDDDGPGVPVAEREHVFDRMVRLDTTRSSGGPAGSGLGLAIARGLARAHGGDLRCEDSELGGARFVLTLPLAGPGSGPTPDGAGPARG
ncbi:Signal transduction histidine kinase [Nocardioides scoriae]|uniref:histidine kinase n=1 Tax=Nocardioides scoriae TaxID=642780 RepID=A0A1H1NS44_9ACTN|nr:HAMP domain-containing sensor histidine kinase [Nocardioides scoriae]SDS01796.1 Signal transduction histidine kinase [Nocardioides scoriae]